MACGASLAVAAASAAATRVSANDLWWHLKTGEWMIVNGAIPRVDPFSFTSGGVPWVDHAWLWQLVAWSLHALAGLGGLAFLKLTCAAVIALAMTAALARSGFGLHRASLLVVICLAGARFRLTDRPETASLALLSIFLWVLLAPTLSRYRRIPAAFLLCAVWANVHAGVLVAPALALLASLAGLIETSRARTSRGSDAPRFLDRARDEGLTAAAALAGALVNPYGYRLLLVPLSLGEALADRRLVNPEWLKPAWETFPLFHAALVAGIALCAFGILKLRNAALWRPLLLIAGSGALALTGARHIGVFFTVLPFAAAAAARPRAVAAPAGGAKWAFLWGILAAVFFPLLPSPITAAPGFGVEPGAFPVSETDYVERNLEPPRLLYNEVGHGGYLIFRLFPEDRVFIDGRNEVHAALLREIAASLDDGRSWDAMLDRHRIASALVRYREERIPVTGQPPDNARSFSALHFPKSRWALVHFGDAAMVFVKRGGSADALIARDEYRYLQPEDVDFQLGRCRAGDRVLLRGILADLKRRVAAAPPSGRAEELLERFGALTGG